LSAHIGSGPGVAGLSGMQVKPFVPWRKVRIVPSAPGTTIVACFAMSAGAARIALATRCPVIPVAQWGPQEVLAPYAKWPKLFPRRTMHLRAGPPVELSDLYDQPVTGALLREATDRIMAAITVELETIRGERAPVERFDSREHGLPDTGNPHRKLGEGA
jgi:1-acyl-sn-glycerol-3-phosphate acyltransferase